MILLQLFVFCTAFLSFVVGETGVPLLLWRNTASKQDRYFSPLKVTSSGEFADFIKDEIDSGSTAVIVFLEPELSSEDFIGNSFSDLKKLVSESASHKYFPAVESPYETVTQTEFPVEYVEDLDKFSVQSSPDRVIFVVHLKQNKIKGPSDRNVFTKTYNELSKKYTNVIGILTGKQAAVERSVIRVSRDVRAPSNSSDGVLWYDKLRNVVFYSPEVPVLYFQGKNISLDNGTSTQMDQRENLQRLIISFQGLKIRLRFDAIDGYWNFSTITVVNVGAEVPLTPNIDIIAPYNFSYHCNGVNFTSKNTSDFLYFSNFQVQPYKVENSSIQFSDSYDCVWFFTGPILSGIFVTVLLSVILMWGLTMLMDIKTNDQFDDPKGKTITVSATD